MHPFEVALGISTPIQPVQVTAVWAMTRPQIFPFSPIVTADPARNVPVVILLAPMMRLVPRTQKTLQRTRESGDSVINEMELRKMGRLMTNKSQRTSFYKVRVFSGGKTSISRVHILQDCRCKGLVMKVESRKKIRASCRKHNVTYNTFLFCSVPIEMHSTSMTAKIRNTR